MATSVTAGPATATALACLPVMSPSAAWQVCWPQVTVLVYGAPVRLYAGELLPAVISGDETSQRHTLHAAGAIRKVTAAYTAAGFAAALAAAAAADVARRAADLTAEGGPEVPESANPYAYAEIGGDRIAGPAA